MPRAPSKLSRSRVKHFERSRQAKAQAAKRRQATEQPHRAEPVRSFFVDDPEQYMRDKLAWGP